MILRRRRVRIEIEQSTLRIAHSPGMEASPLSPTILDAQRPHGVTEPISRSEFGLLPATVKDDLP
jgi:hypothetical protein